jgi:hypothetical protein
LTALLVAQTLDDSARIGGYVTQALVVAELSEGPFGRRDAEHELSRSARSIAFDEEHARAELVAESCRVSTDVDALGSVVLVGKVQACISCDDAIETRIDLDRGSARSNLQNVSTAGPVSAAFELYRR